MTGTPWLTTREAAAYTRRPTLAAFRIWARRHGIVMVGRRVNRRDIDAVLTAAIGYRTQQTRLPQRLNQLANRER
jgi:hypothetical protein